MRINAEEEEPKANASHLLQIHLATLLFGLAGLFGKWLSLHPLIIVLGRVFFASLSLGILLLVVRQKLVLSQKKDAFFLGALGMVLAIHWAAFFHSIQVSTIAIGLLTFSTFPVFTVLLEPLFFGAKWHWPDLLIAGLTFAGVLLIIPDFELKSDYTQGALWGMLSGLSFAFLAILNRKYVRNYSGIQLAFFQDLTATLLLLPFYFYWSPTISTADFGLLLILGVLFTALSHSLFINGLQTVKANTASVIASLEPVYGILAAAFLLHEIPGWREITGGSVILSMAFFVSLRRS